MQNLKPGRIIKSWITLLAIKLILFCVILAATYYFVEFEQFVDHFTWELGWAVILVQPLVFLTCVPITTRFHMLTMQRSLRFWAVYKAMLVGLGLNLIVPGRAAELLKIVYLRKNGGLSYSAGIAALFMERLGDLIIAGLLALFSLNLLVFGLDVVVVAMMLAIVGGGIVLVPYFERPLFAVLSWLPWTGPAELIKNSIRHVIDGVKSGLLYKSMFIGGFAWFLSFLTVYLFLVFANGSIDISPVGALALLIAVTFGSAIPALPAGLGTYEAAGVLVLSGLGFDFEEALAITLGLHASQFVFIFLAGLAVTVIEGSGVSALISDVASYRRDHKIGIADETTST